MVAVVEKKVSVFDVWTAVEAAAKDHAEPTTFITVGWTIEHRSDGVLPLDG